MLSGYRLEGAIYAIMDDNTTDVVTTLYVYVTDADPITTNLIPTVTADAANDYSYAAGENAKQLKFTITAPTGTMTYSVEDVNGAEIDSGAVPANGQISFYPVDAADQATASSTGSPVVAGDYTITVVNTKDGKTETKSFTYTVTDDDAAAVTGVEITTAPKTSYNNGDKLDLSAMIVKVTYSNGTDAYMTINDAAVKTSIANGTELTYAGSENGNITLTVTVGGESDTVPLTVAARAGAVTIADATDAVISGDSVMLAVSASDGATITSVESADPSKVTVSLNASKTVVTITAISGTADETVTVTLKGTSEGGSDVTDTCTVTLKNA